MSNKNNKKQVKTKPPRLRYNWKKIWKSIIDLAQSWNLVKILIPIEIILNIYIIKTVNYTEIDWSTYMVQVQHVLNGTFDYAQIEGPTGPLVYPAGHVWFFLILYGLTGRGSNISLAQFIYACIYIINLIVVYKIYSHHRVKQVSFSNIIVNIVYKTTYTHSSSLKFLISLGSSLRVPNHVLHLSENSFYLHLEIIQRSSSYDVRLHVVLRIIGKEIQNV